MTNTSAHVYLTDANFNVTTMLDATVLTSPSVVEWYWYTPYGEATHLDARFSPLSTQASAIANTYLYTGRWRNPNTGLQLNRNRWLTRDPIGYRGGGRIGCETKTPDPLS